MKEKIVDNIYNLSPKTGYGRSFEVKEGSHDGQPWKDISGVVMTPQGIVLATSSVWSTQDKTYRSSSLEMIKDGKEYSRDFRKDYSKTGLVTKAKQFALEVYK